MADTKEFENRLLDALQLRVEYIEDSLQAISNNDEEGEERAKLQAKLREVNDLIISL